MGNLRIFVFVNNLQFVGSNRDIPVSVSNLSKRIAAANFLKDEF